MRNVCIQFQPDRAGAAESRIREVLHETFAGARIETGYDNGRYENITFKAQSIEKTMSKLRAIFDLPFAGRIAKSSCIATCDGKHGWDDYLLLHHYDRTLVLDAPDNADGHVVP
jgi:hypothetical protein